MSLCFLFDFHNSPVRQSQPKTKTSSIYLKTTCSKVTNEKEKRKRRWSSGLDAGNEVINSSERHNHIDIAAALGRHSTRSGVGADDPSDGRLGSGRPDNHAAIPGKRALVRSVLTSFRCSLGDNYTLTASPLVGDGPLWKAVGEAEEEIASPETVSGNEFGSAITMGFSFAVEVE